MPATSSPATSTGAIRRSVLSLAGFAAGATPVLLLAFSRGGYPVEVIAGYGVALWWLLLVGFLTRVFPAPAPTRAGRVVVVALAALVLWGTLSLTWSADPERGLTEVVRFVVALGTLLLALSVVRGGQGRMLCGGVLGGLTVVVSASVLSRLQPDLVPQAAETASVLKGTVTRLAWPLNYWNGIGAAAGIAISLALALGVRARSPVASALAVAPVPVLALGIAFTLSRGGIVAAGLGAALVLALVSPRPVALRTILVAGAGALVLLEAGLRSAPLTEVVGGAAQSDDGASLLLLAAVTTVLVGVVQGALASADARGLTPAVPRPSALVLRVLAGLTLAGVVAVAIAVDAPRHVDDAWQDFQAPRVTASRSDENSAQRLDSISSNGRYAMWSGAVRAAERDVVRGLGLGSWESWWNPRRRADGFVRNAHSEGFELLAETGVLGAALFLLVMAVPLAALVRRAPKDAVIAGPAYAAFVFTVLIDWNWQLGAVMVSGIALAAPALSRVAPETDTADPRTSPALPTGTRARWTTRATSVGFAVVALAAIAVLATSLVAPQAVEDSRRAAARGDFRLATRAARAGADGAPFAASPLLQLAAVEEEAGSLPAAADAAREAIRRTPDDWRPWFVLSRLEVAMGRYPAAVQAFREARRRNPRSTVLVP